MSQQNSSNSNSQEAHEVQSVRKRVEGMGVENPPEQQELTPTPNTNFQPTQQVNSDFSQTEQINSDQPDATPNLLPPSSTSTQPSGSWDAYADLRSPFACFAPRPNYSVFVQHSITPSSSKESSADPPLARAFAPSNYNGSSNSLCPNKFPSGSDFFLKGKRNTPLTDSSLDADAESVTQNKKLKLPPSSTCTSVPTSSTSSSSNHTNSQSGFASYAVVPSTSLRSTALDKLNRTPSLQTSSAEPTSEVSNFLKVHPPSSVASSACAVNGETDDLASASSTLSGTTSTSTQVPNSFGFSAFANKSGFESSSKPTTDWSDRASNPSVFDQNPQQSSSSSDPDAEPNTEKPEWGTTKSTQRKTHLALSAELSQEDKHEGFLATEVITGEENEDLIKSVRCKMFTLGEDGSWRERGTGGLRLLKTKAKPYRFRLIMRADAVLRVLLNVPIFKGFSYRPTQEKFLTFASTVVVSNQNDEDKPVNPAEGVGREADLGNNQKTHFQQYLCRFGKPEARQEMINGIHECLKELEGFQSYEADEQGEQENSYDALDLV